MTTCGRVRIVRRQIALMTVAALSLTVFDALSYGSFFGVSLLGLLIITELSASRIVTVPWQSRLRWLGALGLLVYGVVVLVRLDEILSVVTLPG